MSLDAGGLAQMTYHEHNFPSGGLGVPSAGFASRGKGAQLKRLSVSPIGENNAEGTTTPRTSRSHLLAGLRTAPKSQTVPASAPYHQTQHHAQQGNGYAQGMPQTAIGSTFNTNGTQQYGMGASQQAYAPHPEQVLAPPAVQYGNEDEPMDPLLLAQLIQTEAYLAQRQRLLQQQLLNITTQQFQGVNMNGGQQGFRQQAQFPGTPHTPQTGLYSQQIQPQIQEVPGQPGLYMVFNPLTGECNYVMDPQVQQQTQLSNSPPPPTPSYTNSPPRMQTPNFRAEVSSPVERSFNSRSMSPPKKSPSPPSDVEPLPPPSANAFRRGHKFTKSVATDRNASTPEGLKSANRLSGLPQTPMTGTFGPGQNRAGEHPMRQPRGPPPLEELVAKPTSKHEGSKNFATRQRRRAVHSLVRAGIERRGVRTSSAGSMTPVSETDGAFSLTSDNDSDSAHSSSGSLSGKPSVGSLRAKASGAIGSERKARKEGSVERAHSPGGCGVKAEERPKSSTPSTGERVKTPRLVFTCAEKRKTSMY